MSKIVVPVGNIGRITSAYTWISRHLSDMGHEVRIERSVASPELWGDYDAQVSIDYGADCFRLPDGYVSHPSLIWQSDTHMARSSYLFRLNESRAYDHVLVAQLPAVKQFFEDGVSADWMPHATEHNLWCPPLKHWGPNRSWTYMNLPPDPEAIDSLTVERIPIYDFCWVGHASPTSHMERTDCLHALFRAFDNWCWEGGVYFEDAVRTYHKCKIVFNRSVYHDLNMRTFEALSTRSFLLTDRQHGMEELGLKDGEHCAIYDTTGEAIEKMAYWLDDSREQQRKDIARAGWEWVLKGHTYWHRARQICRVLGLDTPVKKE